MQLLMPAIVALVIASGFAGLELITTKYSRTFFVFCRRSSAFYMYSIIYGIFALFLVLSADVIGLPKLTGISDPWIEAIVVGVSVKAFLHIRLFSVPASISGGNATPVGLETLVQFFEPPLLTTIDSDETYGLHTFLDRRVEQYPDHDDVKMRIMHHLPQRMDPDRRIAFKKDIEKVLQDQDGSVFDAMSLYLYFMGRRNLELAFPL